MEEQRQYHGGFVWPILLIGAGVLFLLNNLGMVDWSVWAALLRFWPVLLIAVGLDILVGRRFPVGSVLLGLALIAFLVLALSGGLSGLPATSAALQVDRTETISQTLDGAERAAVRLGFGAGEFALAALPAGSDRLIEGTVDLSRGEELTQSYESRNGIPTFVLESRGSWSLGPDAFGDSDKMWELAVNRDVPLDLELDAGAGKSVLDLTNLTLRRFDLNGGVGQVTVKLPASGRYEMQLDGGVGQIIVMAPQGLAVRVQVDGGLGGVSTQGDFRRQGDAYVIGDPETATNRALIEVDGGVGQVVLRALSE
jgi:hypothetical protein